jgi:hypothetical protein
MMSSMFEDFVPDEEKFWRRRKAVVMLGWDEELLC